MKPSSIVKEIEVMTGGGIAPLPTHIEAMRREYLYMRKQIIWLTGISYEDYQNLMYDTALRWLTEYTNLANVSAVLAQPEVWKWWLLEWDLRDHTHNLHKLYNIPRQMRGGLYKTWHRECLLPGTPMHRVLEQGLQIALAKINRNLLTEHSTTIKQN